MLFSFKNGIKHGIIDVEYSKKLFYKSTGDLILHRMKQIVKNTGPTNTRPGHLGQVEKYAGQVFSFQKKPARP